MIKKLSLILGFLFVLVGCSPSPMYSDKMDDVTAWKPFMGPKSTMTISLDKSVFVEGVASLKMDFKNGDWAGIGCEFPVKPSWNLKNALSFKVKGDGMPHMVSVEVTDKGGERFNHIISVASVEWQTMVIPLKDFIRRKDWQPDKAPVDGLTLKEVEGLSFSVGEKEVGTVYIDDLMLVKK